MIVNNHILTEGSDFLDTEASDRLITEQGSETGGTGNIPVIPGRWQYQVLAWCPMLISAAPPLNKIQPILDIPIVSRAAKALITAISAGSLFMPWPVQAPVPRLNWEPLTEQPVLRLKDQSYITDFEFSPDPIPITPTGALFPQPSEGKPRDFVDTSYIVPEEWIWDSKYDADYSGTWQFQDVIPFERPDNRYVIQGEYRTGFVAAELIYADKWLPSLDRKPDSFKDQSYITDFEFSGDPIPIIPSLSVYAGTYPDILFRQRDHRYTYQTEAWPNFNPVVFPDRWMPSRPDILFRAKDLRYTYPSEFRQPSLIVLLAPFDWQVSRPDVLPRQVDLRYTYPNVFLPIFPPAIFADRWEPSFPDIINRVVDPRFTYPNHFMYVLPLPSPVFLDKWVPEYPDRIDKLQSRTWITYPVLELTQSQRPEVIFIDKYEPTYPDYFRAKELRYTYPSLFRPDGQPLVLVDRYYEPIVQPQVRITRQFEYGGNVYVVTPPFNKLDWIPSVPDYINRLRSLSYITTGDLILTPAQRPEIITLDKWFNQTSLPLSLFTLKKLQYLDPTGSEFYTGVPLVGAANTRLIIIEGRLAYKVAKKVYVYI